MLGNLLLFSILSLILGPSAAFSRGGVSIYLFDVVLFITTLVFFIEVLKRKILIINFQFLLFVTFSLISLLITIFKVNFYDLGITLAYLARFVVYFLFSYFSFLLVKSGVIIKSTVFKYLKFSFIFMIIANFFQYIFLRDISFMSMYGFDPHTERLTGFFLDPNFLGIFIIIFYYVNSQNFKSLIFEYLSILMVSLTQSRSAVLCLIFAIILINLKDFKKILFNLLFLILILNINTDFYGRVIHTKASNDSSSLRVSSWINGIYVYSFSDFFGVGFNNYRNSLIKNNLISPENYFSNSSSYSDSSLISVLAMVGILGLSLYFLFLLSYGLNYKNIVLLAIIFLNSIFINSLFYPSIIVLVFLILNLNLIKD